jgi:hypothetical protein
VLMEFTCLLKKKDGDERERGEVAKRWELREIKTWLFGNLWIFI